MGRKVRITREMILEAAYEILDGSGIGAVGIKAIAEKLGCSTQPISWVFGSMKELKKELFRYANAKIYEALPEQMAGKNAIDAFFASGVYYISIACDHPNVFRFITVDDPMDTIGEPVRDNRSIFSFQFDASAANLLAEEYDVPPEIIDNTVRDIVIYAHGLAVMMMHDSFRLPKEDASKMAYDVAVKLLHVIGIDVTGA
ncbi:MAG: TetR/AcrR family transcriptional regulator [Clostridia bacterium]|nr:TetR/AcrR family transcriptional regulator [Clostridia bacterium]